MEPLKDITVSRIKSDHIDLVNNMPYVLEDKVTKGRTIGVLLDHSEYSLTFNVWDKNMYSEVKSIVLSAEEVANHNIYKADVNNGLTLLFGDEITPVDKSEDTSPTLFDVYPPEKEDIEEEPIQHTKNEKWELPTGTIACHRIIDYKNQTIGRTLTLGIDHFYRVDPEVTIIRQFLYKVEYVKDNKDEYVSYEILLPTTESDKKHYMDAGYKIHPMFYSKDADCYMPTVILHEKQEIDFHHTEDDSITIEILSGLQLLYLIEFGTLEGANATPGKYAGIPYNEGEIVISKVYANARNELVKGGRRTGISIKDETGYISKFMYWNEEYDWLFLPKETTAQPKLTDSFYGGPTPNCENYILWGTDVDRPGMFRLWMYYTEADDAFIIPWEFGEGI